MDEKIMTAEEIQAEVTKQVEIETKKFEEDKKSAFEAGKLEGKKEAEPVIIKNVPVVEETIENKQIKAVENLSVWMKDAAMARGVKIDKATTSTTNTPAFVPPQYEMDYVPSVGTFGVARSLGTTKIATSNIVHRPRVTGSLVSYVEGELQNATGSQLQVKDETMNLKANTVKLALTKEFLSTCDGYDIQSLLDYEVNFSIGQTEDRVAISGSSAGLNGMYTNSDVQTYSLGVGSGSFALTYQNITGLEAQIDPSFKDCVYMLDNTHFAAICNITGSAVGGLIYDKTSDTINGKNYIKFSNGIFNSTAVSGSGTKWFAYGDPKNFWFADNGKMEVLIDPYTSANTREINYYFTKLFTFGIRNPKGLVVVTA